MDDQQKDQVFQAQTTNVRALEKTWAHLNRHINELILLKNEHGVRIATKLLALIYCALAEAIFSKLLHTPDCLTVDEIDQVKAVAAKNGIKCGWLKCAQLAVQRVDGAKSNHGPNVLQKLSSLIEKYIFDPSLIRNKMAHGQWEVALNRENTAINAAITKEIESHTIVELYRRKYALEKLAAIVEDIIESPEKAHPRDYWLHLTEMEEKQGELVGWTYEKKVEQLFKKKAFVQVQCIKKPSTTSP
jgi:hypothetical protein